MKNIFKCLKKRRLIKKYSITKETMERDLFIFNMMKNNKEMENHYLHKRYCEIRCLNRLKKL